MDNIAKYLVYIPLPTEIKEKICELRMQEGINGDLDFPHCTLFMTKAKKHNEKRIVRAIMPITRKNFIFQARLEEICKFDRNTVIKLKRDGEIIDVHNQILNALNPYSLMQSQYFGDNYNPHITIGEIPAQESLEIPKTIKFPKEFQVSSFFLARKDNNADKYKTVREFPFLTP